MSIHDIHVPTLHVGPNSSSAFHISNPQTLQSDSKTDRIPTSKRSTPLPRPRYIIKPKSSSVTDMNIKGMRPSIIQTTTPSTKVDDENRSHFDTLAETSSQLPYKSSSTKSLQHMRTPVSSYHRPYSAKPNTEKLNEKVTLFEPPQDDQSEISKRPSTARVKQVKYRSIIINGQPVQIIEPSPSNEYDTPIVSDRNLKPWISRPTSASKSSNSSNIQGFWSESSSKKSRNSNSYLSPADRNKLKLKNERLNIMYSSPYGKPIRGKKVGESIYGNRYIPIHKYFFKPQDFLQERQLSMIRSSIKTKFYISPKPF